MIVSIYETHEIIFFLDTLHIIVNYINTKLLSNRWGPPDIFAILHGLNYAHTVTQKYIYPMKYVHVCCVLFACDYVFRFYWSHTNLQIFLYVNLLILHGQSYDRLSASKVILKDIWAKDGLHLTTANTTEREQCMVNASASCSQKGWLGSWILFEFTS